MGLFSRRQTNTSNHAPAEFRAECAGEECPNWSGVQCGGTKFIWEGANATTTEGRDTSIPPLKDEALFVTYGRYCLLGKKPDLISYRVDDYDNGHFFFEDTGLIIHGDSRFTDKDVDVYLVGEDSNGQRTEELKHHFDGWG